MNQDSVPATKEANVVKARKAPARSRVKRPWLPWIGGIVLLLLIVAGLWPKPVPVEIAKVTVGTLRSTVNEEGKTRIRQRYLVTAPVTGQLRRAPFKAGAEVKAGETVVAIIDPAASTPLDARARALAEARRDSAAANLDKARASLDFAVSELRRFEKLFVEKTISPQELENVQWREISARKEAAAAESALKEAQAQLAEFGLPDSAQNAQTPREVRAPVSGRVLRVLEENARPVTAGTPLLEIGDPTDLEVVVEVLSRDGAAMVPGTPVEMEQWGGGKPLLGKVRLVEPAAFTKVSALGVEEQRVNVIVDLTTPVGERTGLGDNFRVDARIIVWQAAQALKVSAGALFRKGDGWAAFAIRDGRAHLQNVSVGRSSGVDTQILDGLKEGDGVIVYPGSRVRDGIRVTPVQI